MEEDEKQEEEEEVRSCRICLESTEDLQNILVAPCRCRGTSKWIHQHCLFLCRIQNPAYMNSCQICHFQYVFDREHAFLHDILMNPITSRWIAVTIIALFAFIDIYLLVKKKIHKSLFITVLSTWALWYYLVHFLENEHADDFRFVLMTADPLIGAVVGIKKLFYLLQSSIQRAALRYASTLQISVRNFHEV